MLTYLREKLPWLFICDAMKCNAKAVGAAIEEIGRYGEYQQQMAKLRGRRKDDGAEQMQ